MAEVRTAVVYRTITAHPFGFTFFDPEKEAEELARVEADPFSVFQHPYDGGEGIQIVEIPILRFTPKGYWVRRVDGPRYGTVVFINREHQKRYAYETRKEAVESFLIRRRRWKGHLQRSLDRCEREAEHGTLLAEKLAQFEKEIQS